jgi:hypothetical protein
LDLIAWTGYILEDRGTNDTTAYQTDFMDYMNANPGENIGWFFGHTHYSVGDELNGRTWTYSADGCLHVASGAISRYHEGGMHTQWFFLRLKEGSTEAKIYKVQSAGGGPYREGDHFFNASYVLDLTLNFAFVAP